MEGVDRRCVEKELHLDEQAGGFRRKCDGAEYGLLWAASRLYALDSSDDGVCARRLGYVLSGPYAEVLFVEGSFSRGSSSLRGLAIHSARGR